MKKRRSKTSKRLQKQRRQENDFFKVVEKQIEGMRALCRPKTVYNCQTALRAFRRYLKEEMPCYKDRLPLRILTLQLIAGFERHLIERGVSLNTSHAYMRSLRSLVNRARSRGYACR
ncbi:MAG: phage integrase SAM-like domain-containing protein, partial [Bacteroidaceae bacterium]|nr:phage integrase SAM-like domain-containing protein [Bacteroidaceae bacterium]